MPGYEPCGFDIVLIEHLQDALDPDGAGKVPPTDIAGGILTLVGSEPTRNLRASETGQQ